MTSTSAQHIANFTKEVYQNTEAELNSIKGFYETKLVMLDNSSEHVTSFASSHVLIEKYGEKIKSVAKLKALIARLREALKAKASIIESIKALSNDDLIKEIGEKPSLGTYLNKIENKITPEDYIGKNFSIKKRNRYFYLETICSTIGKYIHPDGAFSNARKDLTNIINNPISVNVNPNEGVGVSYLYKYSPAYQGVQEDDEKVFTKLQSEYREYQKELNSMKFEINEAVDADKIRYENEKNDAVLKYQNELMIYQGKKEAFKTAKINEVSNFKIIIPDVLKGTFDYISELEKGK